MEVVGNHRDDQECIYVGNEEYRRLPVLGNLDLYLREQVFSPKRPFISGPYMRGGSSHTEGRLVSVPDNCKAEKFVAVFSERVIAIDGTGSSIDASSSSSSSLQRKCTLQEEDCPEELLYLILTDATLYIAEADFTSDCTFGEVPLLTVTHFHPLYSLW